MKQFLFALVIFSCSAVFSQKDVAAEGISFEHGTWKEALAKAKKEKKLVMLDAYASWCGPCKWMAKNIFPQKEVGEFFNKNFVCIKIDMEKGEGIELANKYNVKAYPTFIFTDADGNLVHQSCGGQEGPDFIETGKKALNPKTRTTSLKKAFDADPKNAENARKFFEAAENACMDVENEAAKYLDNIAAASYQDSSNFMLIMKFMGNYDHASIKYILRNYEKFTAMYTKDLVDSKLLEVYRAAVSQALRNKSKEELATVQAAYRAEKNAPADWLDAFAKMAWAKTASDTAAYFPAAVEFADKFLQDDGDQLNAYAWDFYEKTNTKLYLLKAEAWAKRSVELKPSYANNDTWAALLYKLGKFEEAKTVAGKAIEYGKKMNTDVKETEELLQKINQRLKA
jgi:thioredoxin-related protein